MKRTFLTLTIVSTLLLIAAFVMGYQIGDAHSVAASTRRLMSYHLLISVAALIFAALVHAVLLTYFMGTSRWMDEVRLAYKLDARWFEENRQLKYRTIPLMVCCLLVLILNIPLGASAVDRGNWTLPGGHSLSPSTVHLAFALLTLVINLAVNIREYRAIERNGELIQEVVQEVRRIRQEHGLPT